MKRGHNTAFYLETLLLIVVFIGIILVFTWIFGLGKAQSGEAKLLTNAVTLAEKGAEAVSAADSPEALMALLNEDGNVEALPGVEGVAAYYDSDMRPDADGGLRMEVTWLPESTGKGTLVHSTVSVINARTDKNVYSLETAVYFREVEP